MNRGIYIIANDRVIEQSIALLNSIGFYDADTPIMLIPYDDNYQSVASILSASFGVKVYEHLEFIEQLFRQLQ